MADGVDGYILNATYQMEGEVPVVHLHGILRDGGCFLVRDREQQAHFYVRHEDRTRLLPLLRADVAGVAETDRRTLDGAAVDRVAVVRPQETPAVRGRLQQAGIQTYEADVRFAYRYLIDRGIQSSVRIFGESRRWHEVDALFDQPRLEPASWTPTLRTLSVDIETDPNAEQLWAVSLHGCGASEVLVVAPEAAATPRSSLKASVRLVANEAELLQTFCQRVRALDPDVIVGWNIIDFDFPVLLRRATQMRSPLELGRGPGATRQREDAAGRNFSDSVFIPGRVVMDGIRLLRGVSVRLDDYTLDTAAREILGEGKTHAGEGHLEFITHSYREDLDTFVEYVLTDARLVTEIIEQLRLVTFAVERSRLTGLPPDRIGASIAAFDFLYLSRLGKRGMVAPTVATAVSAAQTAAAVDAADAYSAESYSADRDVAPGVVADPGPVANQGGHVLASLPGLYANVLLFDFKSLYPSVIRTFQIDPAGFAGIGSPERDDELIQAPNGARFRREPGILTDMLDELFESRSRAVVERNLVASKAIKILMNSFYGVLGTPACRFHNPDIANAITSFGKHFLLWARDWMERQDGLEVLYGDTDSLFVCAGGNSGEGLDDAAGTGFAARVNADLSVYVSERWALRSRLELEYECRYERFFIPRVRGGKRGATKRYVGLRQGSVEFTGMEVVRRDWTDLAHEVQRELYRRLFADEPMAEYLRGVVAEVLAGRRDGQLVYRKALRKRSGEYRAVPPHVVAARKLQAARTLPADSGANPFADRDATAMRGIIDYLITVEGPEPASLRQHALDYEHYITRQLQPVAEPVLAIQHVTFDEVRRNERQLELF